MLLSNEGFFQTFVHAVHVFEQKPALFLGGSYGNTRAQLTPKWRSMALRIDFTARNPCLVSVPRL